MTQFMRLSTVLAQLLVLVSLLCSAREARGTGEPSPIARPIWLTVDEATLHATNMTRVQAEGETRELCHDNLQQAIRAAIDRRILLAAEEVELPKHLESQIWPEQFDESLMEIERLVEVAEKSETGMAFRGWARIHFLPRFTQVLQQRVADVRRGDRLRSVGLVFAAALLALTVSFGYLQGRQRRQSRTQQPWTPNWGPEQVVEHTLSDNSPPRLIGQSPGARVKR